MKLKKLFAVVLACCVCSSFIVITAFAAPTDVPKDFSLFVTDVWDLSNSFDNGEISKTEFLEKFANSMGRFGINYAGDVTSFKDVLKVVEFCGIAVPDDWKDWFSENKMGGDGIGGNRDDSILDGYGALLVMEDSKKLCSFCDYIVVKNVNGDLCYDLFNRKHYVSYNSDGSIYQEDFNVANTSYMPSMYFSYSFILYGDVRYSDGSTADDVITPFPEKEIPAFDDDSVSEDDILDFFKDLLQDLQMQFPNLTTIEGLLRAILAKLGTLDSDNDNELLMQILTAIQALKNSGETVDNSELLKTLEELKNALSVKDGEKVSSLAELLNELVQNQVRRSDFTIDESLYNQRYALIETKLLGKFSFISEIKNFVQYAIDSYSSSSENPSISISLFGLTHSMDFSAFDDNIDLIRFCVAAFVYLTFAFNTFRRIPGYINGGDNE